MWLNRDNVGWTKTCWIRQKIESVSCHVGLFVAGFEYQNEKAASHR